MSADSSKDTKQGRAVSFLSPSYIMYTHSPLRSVSVLIAHVCFFLRSSHNSGEIFRCSFGSVPYRCPNVVYFIAHVNREVFDVMPGGFTQIKLTRIVFRHCRSLFSVFTLFLPQRNAIGPDVRKLTATDQAASTVTTSSAVVRVAAHDEAIYHKFTDDLKRNIDVL
ncbi:hypothetical protein SCHPADRAFT_620817 [Schizopora paradoxa]|uniref:Uncharacterized protein n=1 Tax=Schizopora paradoxa TaxID=27342 RepID=A0A0H2RTH2_9AGAM|nr:hypothetical protein SCHPADRAFT_620817 [Schizopora paradoxa]